MASPFRAFVLKKKRRDRAPPQSFYLRSLLYVSKDRLMRKTRRGDREEAELHDVLQATPHMPHVLPTELTAVYTRNTY